jgi:hypothetical protein
MNVYSEKVTSNICTAYAIIKRVACSHRALQVCGGYDAVISDHFVADSYHISLWIS